MNATSQPQILEGKDSRDIKAARMQMLREILPEKITQIQFASVDMDITLLSIADILRNINKTFPKNTSNRNAIANGQLAIAVLCKTKLLKPLDGMIIIVTSDPNEIRIKSKNYLVVGVSEDTISSSDHILGMLDNLTTYLIHNYGDEIPSFEKFYTLFIYDACEFLED